MRHLTKLAVVLLVTRALFAADPVEVVSTGTWNSGTYQYDGSGNIKAIGTNVYRYDTAGRLVSANVDGTGHIQTYQYDAFGNRNLATTTPARACIGGIDCEENVTIDPATNHIGSAGNLPSYDDAGNLVGLDGTNYVYDSQSMLRSQSNTGAQFIYTASDERLATISGGAWSWTVRDLGGKVLSDFTSADGATTIGNTNFQWKKDYVYRDGLLLAASSSSGTEHFHLDHVGTPRLITDASGAEIGAHTYFPFGTELALTPTESPVETMKFTGHERDYRGSVQDLDYMHARYYGAAVGRFLSMDPAFSAEKNLAKPQLWNRYAYVTNNPITSLDPDGKAENDFRCVECTPAGKVAFDRATTQGFKWGAAALALVAAARYGPSAVIAVAEWAFTNPNQATQTAEAILSPPGASTLPNPEAIGTGIGQSLAGQKGQMAAIVERVTAEGLTQEGAAVAAEAAVKATGLGTAGIVRVGEDLVVASRRVGVNQPVLAIDAAGTVRKTFATIEINKSGETIVKDLEH